MYNKSNETSDSTKVLLLLLYASNEENACLQEH